MKLLGQKSLIRAVLTGIAVIGVMAMAAYPASASTVWTDWTRATLGSPGSAVGILNGVGVTYAGEVLDAATNGAWNGWSPNTSFIGGTVTTSPSTVGDTIGLQGATGTNTISFASPIVDPVFAFWSLGSSSVPASFTFDSPPIFEAGGPNSSYGGLSITVSSNVVSGSEGNGVVQFTGTFSSISWTDTPEFWYAFTVGMANSGQSAIPEPTSLLLLGTGLGAIGLAAWRKRK